MANKLARKRYFQIFIPAMIGYIISIFVIDYITDNVETAPIVTYTLALVPAVFVFIWVWSHARYVLEVDEFVRFLQVKSMLAGWVMLMVLTTAWGFLEMFANAPAAPIFYVLPGFYLCYGISSIIIGRQHNAGCEML